MLSEGVLEALATELGGGAEDGGVDRRRSRQSRRAAGAYFTPPPLVRFVVEEVLRARWAGATIRWRDDGSPELVVLDPAAGDGRFLVEAVRQLADGAAAKGFNRAEAADAIARRCVIGVERDPEFAGAACRAVGAPVVHCGEALLAPPPALAEPVDVVVGNPPYLRSIHLGRADAALHRALRGRYAATSYGEWDLYAAFLEQSLSWTRAGGEIGLVVPSRWLTAAFAAKLRDKLARARAVRALVDFGAGQIFDGATTYAGVAFLSRRPSARVTVARRDDCAWRLGTIEGASLDERPWRLAVGERRAMIAKLAGGPELGAIARIAKGAGTNADRVFVLEEAVARGGVVKGLSRQLGERVEVEAQIVAVCIRGRDVRRYRAPSAAIRCLVPYDRDGHLIPPPQLEATFPRAAAYLVRCRERLDARERGRFSGPTYYQFGRPQNLAFHWDPAPKVVFPDVAREGRALWDGKGAMLLDTAYAIRVEHGDYPLAVVLAVMNSPVVAFWLRETGIRLRGDYVRMKTAYLQSLPLPRPSTWTRAVERAIAPLCRGQGALAGPEVEEEIADLVRRAYGLTAREWDDLANV